MKLVKEDWKTIADMEALPEGTPAELIDGQIYHLVSPSTNHQIIAGFLCRKIGNYIESHQRECYVFPTLFDVQLSADDNYNLVQPDVTVVCDCDKLKNGKRCIGAPDWIIEIVSPSTWKQDYIIKADKYLLAGVREYWIIDPEKKYVFVYNFEADDYRNCSFHMPIKVGIYPDLEIDLSQLKLY